MSKFYETENVEAGVTSPKSEGEFTASETYLGFGSRMQPVLSTPTSKSKDDPSELYLDREKAYTSKSYKGRRVSYDTTTHSASYLQHHHGSSFSRRGSNKDINFSSRSLDFDVVDEINDSPPDSDWGTLRSVDTSRRKSAAYLSHKGRGFRHPQSQSKCSVLGPRICLLVAFFIMGCLGFALYEPSHALINNFAESTKQSIGLSYKNLKSGNGKKTISEYESNSISSDVPEDKHLKRMKASEIESSRSGDSVHGFESKLEKILNSASSIVFISFGIVCISIAILLVIRWRQSNASDRVTMVYADKGLGKVLEDASNEWKSVSMKNGQIQPTTLQREWAAQRVQRFHSSHSLDANVDAKS